MRFKVDENLPGEIATDLRAAGHEAETAFDKGLAGAVDSVIIARVQSEGRAILTMDKGMADIRAYPPGQFAGIILLRPGSMGRSAVLAFARQHLPNLLAMNLNGRL